MYGAHVSCAIREGSTINSMKIDARRIELPDAAMVECLRRMTPTERLAVARNMWVSARNAIRLMLAQEHPDWDEVAIARETARRMLHGAV